MNFVALWIAFVLFSVVFYKDDPAVLRLRAAKTTAAAAAADVLDG